MPEDRRIFAKLTAWETPDIADRAADRRDHWTIGAVFDPFPQLAGMRTRMGGYLWGDEQQMQTIA